MRFGHYFLAQFSNHFRIAKVGIGIDIEALFVLTVTFRFYYYNIFMVNTLYSQ